MNQFSVIVPIYKVEEFLRKCIESILNQTFTDFELILVDDGSPDNCPKICDEYARKDRRIKVIHKPNGGLVSARNTGVCSATGKYICYVDGDDWIKSTLLETVNRAIAEYAPDMVVFGAVKQFQDRQISIRSGAPEGFYGKDRLQNEIYPYMMYDSRKPFCSGLVFPVAWNKIYKRELLLEHYCRDERICMGEDNAFIFECLYYANSVMFLDDSLYYYNQMNVNSFIHRYDPNRFQNNKVLTDYIENRLGGKDAVLDDQINAFKAYWLIMAVFHEIKSGIGFREAAKHIRSGISATKCLDSIRITTLPKSAQAILLLLKMKCYRTTIMASKIVNSLRK